MQTEVGVGVSLPGQPVGQAMCPPEEAAHHVSCDTWSWRCQALCAVLRPLPRREARPSPMVHACRETEAPGVGTHSPRGAGTGTPWCFHRRAGPVEKGL